MKSLLMPIVAVAAATLWFSDAEARDSRGHASYRSASHASHASHRAGHSFNRHAGHAEYRHSGYQQRHQWQRHGDSGRQWGQSHRDNGRHLGHSRHDQRRFGDRGHDDRSRFSHSGYNGRSVNERQWGQRESIRHASHNGSLTGAERQSLWSEQRAIAAKERDYRSDGRFTREERKDIKSDLKLASRHIYNESHDAERRHAR